MKRIRVWAAAMAAAVGMGMALAPQPAEAGIARHRDGSPRRWVTVVKGAAKAVTHPFGSRVRKNQRGGLVGSF